MPLTEFPNGVSSYGAPVLPGAPALPISPGANVFYVDSANTASRNAAGAGTVDRPFASIDFAVGRCTANNGDFIFVQPGHLENVTAAAGLDLDVAGITIVFLGNGQDRGRIRFGTVVGADMDVDAADIKLVRPRFQANLDNLTAPIDVNAARFKMLGATWEDGTAINTIRAMLADANADDLEVDGFEFIDGDGLGTQKVALLDVAAATRPTLRNIKITGDFSTGCISNSTAWIDALLENLILDNANAGPVVALALQATSTGWVRNASLRVASGTTYVTANNDMQFDRVYGTGTDATATEEVGTQGAGSLEAKIDVIDGFHDVPTADVATNAQMRDVVGNKTDAAAAGAVSAVESLMAYVKQVVTEIGTLVNTGGTATVGGIVGDVANTSIATRLTNILNQISRAAAFGWGACDAGMAASQTVIVSANLSGLGDDFFNNRFYMQVLVAGAAAPEAEVRLITDYVSATGTFTTNAFSVNVEANDIVLILHESAVHLGRDDADNTSATTNVVANENGSVLERLEQVQEAVNVGTGTSLPANTSLADFVGKGTGTQLPANASLHDELAGANGIAVYPAAAVPGNAASIAQVLRDIWDAVRNGTGGTEPATNRSIVDETRDAVEPNVNHARHILVAADFTDVTWNTVATHEVFTVTGLCRLRIWINGTGNVGSAGGAATISFGHETNTAAYIAATDETELDDTDLWYDATPTTADEAFGTAVFDRVVDGLDVGFQIAVEALTGGSLAFHCAWDPLEAGATVAAGAGGVL